jgi:hypothetical protein
MSIQYMPDERLILFLTKTFNNRSRLIEHTSISSRQDQQSASMLTGCAVR